MQTYEGHCCQNRKAEKMCMNEICKYNSFICEYQDCSCKTRHINCLGKVQVNIVMEHLKRKNGSFDVLHTGVSQFYDSIIKFLTQEKQQHQKKFSEGSVLKSDERVLFDYISNKESSLVMPDLVFNVVKSLKLEPVLNIDKKLNFFEEETKKIRTMIDIRFGKIRELWTIEDKIPISKRISTDSRQIQLFVDRQICDKNYVFEKELCHNNYSVSNNCQNLKLNNISFNYAIGMMTFPIQQPTRVCLRIVKKSSQFYIGVCSQQSARSSNFQGTKAYLISSSGHIMNPSNTLQNSTLVEFKFSKDDIVEILCNPFEEIIKFTNKYRQMKAVLNFKKQKKSTLRFCICLSQVSSEVQIVPYIQK